MILYGKECHLILTISLYDNMSDASISMIVCGVLSFYTNVFSYGDMSDVAVNTIFYEEDCPNC